MKATVNGIETHYELHGREGAPWLVFSHSLACSMGMNLTARLKEINAPVLAIAGESDVALPGTRLIHEKIPGSKLVVLREAAHISNLEQPEAFNRALAEFLSSLPSA